MLRKLLKHPFLIILIIGMVVFLNSLGNDFVGDDHDQISFNLAVHSISNIGSFFTGSTFNTGGYVLTGIYYKPIQTTIFSIIYSIFGDTPIPFHIFQVAIHIINASLVFLLLRSFFNQTLSLFLALVFLIHPANDETVVYISNLQDSLYAFFGLLALNLIRKINSSKFFDLLLIFTLLLLSLLSKETGVIFIFLLPIYCWLFKRGEFIKSIFTSTASFLIYLFMRFYLAKISINHDVISPIMKLSLIERLINLPKIIFFYIKDFFFPKDLAIAQSWVVRGIDWPNFYLPLLLDLAFFSLIFYFGWYIRGSKLFKPFIFFSSILLLGLSIHSQIIPLDMTVADRWFYISSIGLLGVLGIVLEFFKSYRIIKKIDSKTRMVWLVVAVVILLIFSVRTLIRNTNYVDALTLYSHDLSVAPESFELENSLGYELSNRGRLTEAEVHFRRSIELFPFINNWTNLAVNLAREKKIDAAKQALNQSLKYGDYYLTYENMAGYLLAYDTPSSAKTFIVSSLNKYPTNPKLWMFLAISEYNMGDRADALVAANKAYSLDQNQETTYTLVSIQNNQPVKLQN